MSIQGSRNRELVWRREGETAIEDGQLAHFLSLFAATCNVKASAEGAGLKVNSVYHRRANDPQFRDAWAVAQDQGVASLKAELVRRGLALLEAASPEEAHLAKLEGMDAKLILSLIGQHERSLGKEPGDIKPKTSDSAEATRRLSELLIRMRLERKREQDRRRAERDR